MKAKKINNSKYSIAHVALSGLLLLSLSGPAPVKAEGITKKYLTFEGGNDRTLSGWTYKTNDAMGSGRFLEDGTPKLFKWFGGDWNQGPDYGFLEIDNTIGVLGTTGSLKYTITGGKNVKTDAINGGEILSKEQYIAYPERVGTSVGGSIYTYFMRGGYQVPEATGANRLSYYLYIPKGWTQEKDGYGNYRSSDFQMTQNHCDPAQNPCTSDKGSNSEGEPTNGQSGHFYHFLKIAKGGGWVHVLLDQHPQHERQNKWDYKNNPTSRDATYGFKNYYDTLATFYLDGTGTQLLTPYNIWLDEMEFYNTSSTAEPNQNDDSISSVTLGYFSNNDGKWGIGFQGYDSGIGTWEIRYSISPITNANFNSATPITAMINNVSGYPGRIKKLAPDAGYPAVWTEFDLPADLEKPGKTIYFAIKDVSQTGQHYTAALGSDTLTSANSNIHTIDYVVAGTQADKVAPTAPKNLSVK